MQKSLNVFLFALGVAALSPIVQTTAADWKGLSTQSPLFGEQPVGITEVVVKTVIGTHSDKLRKLAYKDDIYHNELIETHEESATEIVFLDDTTLSLGPNSEITLDRFVYDPNQNAGSFVMTVTQGALRFASGKLSSDSYKIRTPAGTIGIRGTMIEINVQRIASNGTEAITTVDLKVIEGEAVMVGCDGETQRVAEGHSGIVTTLAADRC